MIVHPAAQLDMSEVLSNVDALAAERPVAARLVAAADAEETDARTLSRILAADVVLSGRVSKLANSAYYGMRGRVASLQLAVTVVGFTTVRTMATVALTDLDDESRLPGDFWVVSTCLAVAASRMAPRFGERPADALCLGVLTPLGSALLYQYDQPNYTDLLEAKSSFTDRRRAETCRYGMSAVELTAVALETWGFPASVTVPMRRIDDPASRAGGLLRASYEVVSRLTLDDHRPVPIGRLSCGAVRDEDLPEILYDVRNEAESLRQMLTED